MIYIKKTPKEIEDRPLRLLKELPKHKSKRKAMLAVGYSKSYANQQPTKTIQTAIKTVEKRALAGDKEAKGLLRHLGISERELMERLRYLALESNQHSVSVQLLAPALKERGYSLDGSELGGKTQINLIVAPQKEAISVYDVVEPSDTQHASSDQIDPIEEELAQG